MRGAKSLLVYPRTLVYRGGSYQYARAYLKKSRVKTKSKNNKTPKVVSVGCVGLWKHNGVLSEFGKIRKPERCVML